MNCRQRGEPRVVEVLAAIRNQADREAARHAVGEAFGMDPLCALTVNPRELSTEMSAVIGRHVYATLDERDRLRRGGLPGGEMTDEQCWRGACDQFGLKCEHPWPMRDLNLKYGGYRCVACDMVVVRMRP